MSSPFCTASTIGARSSSGIDSPVQGLLSSIGGMDNCGLSGAGRGATSFKETVVSRPFLKRMCAYCGVAWIRSASSTKGSYLLWRTCLRINTVPGELSHEGTDIPRTERLEKFRKRSWGVVFVAVQSRERMECKT